MEFKDFVVGEKYIVGEVAEGWFDGISSGGVVYGLHGSNDERSVAVSKYKDLDVDDDTTSHLYDYIPLDKLTPYKEEKSVEQSEVKIIGGKEPTHRICLEKSLYSVTGGKWYDAVESSFDDNYFVVYGDEGDRTAVDKKQVVDVMTVGEKEWCNSEQKTQTLGEVLKQKLDKFAEWEKCKEKAPVLWTAYKDKLNDEALEALMDVILDSVWEFINFEDSDDLLTAFTWYYTAQGESFWDAVYNGKYDKPVEASQTASEPLNSITHVTTPTVVENAVESDCVAGISALDVQEGGNHYKSCGIQPIEYIHANNLDYFQGNVVKYVSRHKLKHGAQDVRKAIHYLELILELQYGEK